MTARMAASRAALGARISSALVRGSASTETAPPVVAGAAPGVPPAELSAKRCTICAMSEATACLTGTTSTSVAAGVSSAAMILASRCRLSA